MIGERLYMLRTEKGLTMKHLGNIIGVTDGAINKYEKNKAEPSHVVLLKMVDYFEISLDFLLGRTNIRNQKIIHDANIHSALLREFEATDLGNITEMDAFFTNLTEAIHMYKENKLSEQAFQTLLHTINVTTILVNDLVMLKVKDRGFNKNVLLHHQKSVSDIVSGLNALLNNIYSYSLSGQNDQ